MNRRGWTFANYRMEGTVDFNRRRAPGGRWCIAWRSAFMRARAFWYVATRADAEQAVESLLQ